MGDKIICYANLENNPEVSDEVMRLFFEKMMETEQVIIEAVVIDRVSNDTVFDRRSGWTEIQDLCEKFDVDYVLIPSIIMMGTHIRDTLDEARWFYKRYKTGVHFYQEYLEIDNENWKINDALFLDMMKHRIRMKENADHLQKIFADINS